MKHNSLDIDSGVPVIDTNPWQYRSEYRNTLQQRWIQEQETFHHQMQVMHDITLLLICFQQQSSIEEDKVVYILSELGRLFTEFSTFYKRR